MPNTAKRTTRGTNEQSSTLVSYSIYALRNPVTEETFYVGCSVNTQNRLYGHIAETKYRDNAKSAIIDGLLTFGYEPELKTLDSIIASDPKIAHRVEQYWILRLLEQGEPLVNKNDATPSWTKTPPYKDIAHIKTIAHLPLDEFNEAIADYYMRTAFSFDEEN